jgi:hypothetical protein
MEVTDAKRSKNTKSELQLLKRNLLDRRQNTYCWKNHTRNEDTFRELKPVKVFGNFRYMKTSPILYDDKMQRNKTTEPVKKIANSTEQGIWEDLRSDYWTNEALMGQQVAQVPHC